MEGHPIQSLMITAMENLKEMVDVNKIVGDAVETPDGQVIIPISRVSFAFAAGGSEFDASSEPKENNMPFGGGSGGGVTIQPVAFLVVGMGQIRMMPVDQSIILDRLMDIAPQIINQVQGLFNTRHRETP